jgi:hypothetical protein
MTTPATKTNEPSSTTIMIVVLSELAGSVVGGTVTICKILVVVLVLVVVVVVGGSSAKTATITSLPVDSTAQLTCVVLATIVVTFPSVVHFEAVVFHT